MYIVFYSTSNVFKAEELLKLSKIECQVVPTPASDRAYCGVCLKVDKDSPLDSISDIEHSIMED